MDSLNPAFASRNSTEVPSTVLARAIRASCRRFKGDLQAYPIEVISGYGTKYIVTASGVQVRFSDAAKQISDKASGIWRMTLGFERLNFLRMGSELVTLDDTGFELDRQNFTGLIFDMAPTDYGLILSAESGYFQWNHSAQNWKKVGSGLPIFAFDGPMARTPLGSIQGQQSPRRQLEHGRLYEIGLRS